MSSSTRDFAQLDRVRLRRRLLKWYSTGKRELPWRDVEDPYRILVSEFMLQQTQVATVLPKFDTFLARFPTLAGLAEAPTDEVLAAWSGLGYYRRARNLQAAARVVQRDHGGALPRSLHELKALPGVGDYTARALASLVHDLPEAVVDGNVIRVLTRLIAWNRPVDNAGSRRTLQSLADTLLHPKRAGDWNQAMMELGALVCTPKSPGCPACPWRDDCAARGRGNPEAYPVKPAGAKSRSVVRALAVLRRGRRYFLVRRQSGSQLRDSWEFPGVDLPPRGKPRPRLKSHLRSALGSDFTVGRELARAAHAITDRRIQLRAFAVEPAPPARAGNGAKWVGKSEAEALFLSSMTRKILDQLD